jgi:acetate kinase
MLHACVHLAVTTVQARDVPGGTRLDQLAAVGATHSFWVREHVCAELAFLGVALDGEANVRLQGGGNIAAGDSTVRVIVVESREDVVIARAARRFAATRVGNP